MSAFDPKRTLASYACGCAIGLSGQPTGGYNVKTAANSAGVGVHSNVHAGSCICTEATETIVPRYVYDAMRVGQHQKPLHADLHDEVQSESVGKKIGLVLQKTPEHSPGACLVHYTADRYGP